MDANDDALGVDEHDLVILAHGLAADDIAGLFGDLVALNALTAAVLRCKLIDVGTLAKSLLGYDHQRLALGGKLHGDDLVLIQEVHADYAHGGAASVAHVGLVEADALTELSHQDDVVLVVGQLDLDELVVLAKVDSCEAVLADVLVIGDLCLFNYAAPGGHEEVLIILIFLDGNHGGNLLFGLQLQEVYNRGAASRARALGNLIGLHAIYAAHVREEHKVVVRGRHHHLGDIVVLDGLHALDALAAAVLALEVIHVHALDVAKLGEGDNGVGHGDEVLHGDVILVKADGRAAIIAVLCRNGKNLLLDDGKQTLLVGKDCLQLADELHELLVLRLKLATLQAGQSAKSHLDNGVGLSLAQAEAVHQLALGGGDILGATDNLDNLVDIIQSDKQALDNVGALLGLV